MFPQSVAELSYFLSDIWLKPSNGFFRRKGVKRTASDVVEIMSHGSEDGLPARKTSKKLGFFARASAGRHKLVPESWVADMDLVRCDSHNGALEFSNWNYYWMVFPLFSLIYRKYHAAAVPPMGISHVAKYRGRTRTSL